MARVFVRQDNYGFWRFSRQADDGVYGDLSIVFGTRMEARDAAKAHFPTDELIIDGVTTGAERPLPMPVIAGQGRSPDEGMT